MDWNDKVLAPVVASVLSAGVLGCAALSWQRARCSPAHIRLKLRSAPDAELRVGLSHIRDGKDQVAGGPGDLRNTPYSFERDGSVNRLRAATRYKRGMGFQFKCYVDYPPHLEDQVRCFLHDNGFVGVDSDETRRDRLNGRECRMWFLLPGVPTCKTADEPPYTNNFYHSGVHEVVHAAEQWLPADGAARRS